MPRARPDHLPAVAVRSSDQGYSLNRKTLHYASPRRHSHYAFSLAHFSLVGRSVGRCYGRRRGRECGPTVYHSLTLTHASASARFAYARRRTEAAEETRIRPTSPAELRARTRAALTATNIVSVACGAARRLNCGAQRGRSKPLRAHDDLRI